MKKTILLLLLIITLIIPVHAVMTIYGAIDSPSGSFINDNTTIKFENNGISSEILIKNGLFGFEKRVSINGKPDDKILVYINNTQIETVDYEDTDLFVFLNIEKQNISLQNNKEITSNNIWIILLFVFILLLIVLFYKIFHHIDKYKQVDIFINHQRSIGKTDENIKSDLEFKGWPESLINKKLKGKK